jgi:Trk K+ transport system NAD-binding subunit
MKRSNRHRIRRIKAGWRDTILLVKEFFWSLVVFGAVLVGGGILYYNMGIQAREPVDSLAEAIYLVLGLIFLQPTIDFPHDWHLQMFFFLLPAIGLSVIAQGVAEFSTLFFNKRARSKEWEMAVASTFDQHVIIIGLGHLGYQTLITLAAMDVDIVAIELNPDTDLITEVQAMGVPVISDDANKQTTLESAGIQKAKSIVLCTQNDPLNMQISIKAKAMNPDLRVVARIFDEYFAQAIQDQFNFTAMSSSVMSAPQFAAAAVGIEMTMPITIEGESYTLARFDIYEKSQLAGLSTGEVEQNYDVSLVLIKRNEETELHPHTDSKIQPHDCIVVLASPLQIKKIIKANG